MTPEEIGAAYDQITHLWEREDFNRDNGIDQHKRALAFAKSQGLALDVGCGCTGRFIDLLLEAGFTPEGLDVSSNKIDLARKRHADLTFYHADICEWKPTKKYDFISAWDSIWHTPLGQQESVLSKLVDALNPGGVFIFSCGGTEEPGDHVDDTMGPKVYYSSLGVRGFVDLFSSLDCEFKHFEFDQFPELHSYFILQKT